MRHARLVSETRYRSARLHGITLYAYTCREEKGSEGLASLSRHRSNASLKYVHRTMYILQANAGSRNLDKRLVNLRQKFTPLPSYLV